MQRNFLYKILLWHMSPKLCNSVKPELSSTSAQVPHVATKLQRYNLITLLQI